MAEGTSLLRMHTAYTCIVGSNPTVSASIFKNPLRRVFSFPHSGDEQSACALCAWDSKPSRLQARGAPNPHPAALRAAVGRTAANAVPSPQALAASSPAGLSASRANQKPAPPKYNK